ncbi:MAG: M23 family metallopeptidase [Gemmatimonadetes bacterium]|nr:M23 family metallopeptidase [Gemmatimonadota bacterium]
MNRIPALLSVAVLLSACADSTPTGGSAAPAPETRALRDDVVGVSLQVPPDWTVVPDPVLFNTYGFALFDPAGAKNGGHDRSPVARVALAYEARPQDVDGLVQELMRKYSEFPLVRHEVTVGGVRGVAVSGLPGTDPYTLVYAADGGRVYRIGVWTAEPGLDARARSLLAGLRFHRPRHSVASLGLTPVRDATYRTPPAEQMRANADLHASRVAMVAEQGGEPPMDAAPRAEMAATACEFGQPGGLFWQTVWDYTNKFYSGYTTTYSGTYYNLRPGDPGWSAMSGNYGSWWGQGYHRRKCDPYLLNQYYANDWPVHKNGNVYSALKGTVEWAGWDYYDSEGYYTLGNYVVVRNGGYRAIMAHLTSIASGISWGASVGMNTVIGYAGRTGGPWDEHVHARVAYGESLTYMGQPYGGSTVWPNKMRCVSCRATDPGDIYGNGDGQYDVKDSTTGAKFYNRFYHGRWMRG